VLFRSTLRNAAVSSFDAAVLGWLAEVRPTWPRWLNSHVLVPATIDLARSLGCAAVSVSWQALDANSVAAARVGGLAVAAWTVRDLDGYRRLADLGVIAICAEDAALDG